MATFSIFQHILAALSYPGNYSRLFAMSEIARVKSWTKPTKVHISESYSGQKILLVALYQKGALREDVIAVLQSAKDKGAYVVAVNSLRLDHPEELRGICDLYVERYNFGRDFGSYKWGFLYLIKQKILDECPRLIMMNDSVFYSRKRVSSFLDEMYRTEIEVLGATENFEINHHLGSFCISISGNVLRTKRFQSYWKRYVLSDVRPAVIDRGEMKLSKTLMRCVSSSDQFCALYDSNRYREFLRQSDNAGLELVIGMTRTCEQTAERFSLVTELGDIEEAYSLGLVGEDNDVQIEASSTNDLMQTRMGLSKLGDLYEVLNARLVGDKTFDQSLLREYIIASLVNNFRQHSQIHQNACILVYMGLPIIKLDCLYRGMLNMLDVDRILDLLEPGEAADLQRMLYARPFGGDVLFGWKRSAFLRGLI